MACPSGRTDVAAGAFPRLLALEPAGATFLDAGALAAPLADNCCQIDPAAGSDCAGSKLACIIANDMLRAKHNLGSLIALFSPLLASRDQHNVLPFS